MGILNFQRNLTRMLRMIKFRHAERKNSIRDDKAVEKCYNAKAIDILSPV